MKKNVNRSRVKGFLNTDGRRIVNGDGEEVLLAGWGLGNWLLCEGYMWLAYNLPRFDRPRRIEAVVEELKRRCHDPAAAGLSVAVRCLAPSVGSGFSIILCALAAAALDGRCKVTGCCGIEQQRFLRLALGTVHGGVSSAVDNDINSIGIYK